MNSFRNQGKKRGGSLKDLAFLYRGNELVYWNSQKLFGILNIQDTSGLQP
jgi:hypothetical protein